MARTNSIRTKINAHTEFKNGCKIWKGTLIQGKPVLHITNGKGVPETIYLQRFVGVNKFKLNPKGHYKFKTTCGNPLCYAPEHIEQDVITRHKSELPQHQIESQQQSLPLQTETPPENYTNNIKLYRTIFNLLITKEIDQIAQETRLTIDEVKSIANSRAMLPYFQMKLKWHIGNHSLEDLRRVFKSQDIYIHRNLKQRFNISSFAYNYIISKQNYPIKNECSLITLLKYCTVTPTQLLWFSHANVESHTFSPSKLIARLTILEDGYVEIETKQISAKALNHIAEIFTLKNAEECINTETEEIKTDIPPEETELSEEVTEDLYEKIEALQPEDAPQHNASSTEESQDEKIGEVMPETNEDLLHKTTLTHRIHLLEMENQHLKLTIQHKQELLEHKEKEILRLEETIALLRTEKSPPKPRFLHKLRHLFSRKS